MERLKDSLESSQVVIYFLAIIGGTVFGLSFGTALSLERLITPALALMLFVTFMQVPIVEVGAALRNVRFIAALVLANFILIPLVVAGLIQFLPELPLLRFAVLFVLLAPCIDYVITFTHLGKGNARLLLAMTPVLLLLQMILLPVYLSMILGAEVSHLIEAGPFVEALIFLIALPLLLAAVLQALIRRFDVLAPIGQGLEFLPVPATAFVLFVVLASVMPQIGLARTAALQAAPIYIAFALIAPFIGKVAANLLRLEASSSRAVSFSASYRNSLVILPLAFAVPGGVPLLPAVILTQTIVELCFMPLYVRLIPKLSK